MELFDYFMQFLLENVSIKDEEFDKIRWSLIVAVRDRHYVIINNDKDKFIGFLTWEIQHSIEQHGKIDIGITNLVIAKKHRGDYPLHRVITYLRQTYPNIDKFIWKNRKRNRLFEAQQKDIKCLSIS